MTSKYNKFLIEYKESEIFIGGIWAHNSLNLLLCHHMDYRYMNDDNDLKIDGYKEKLLNKKSSNSLDKKYVLL